MAIYAIHAPPSVGNPAHTFPRTRVLPTGFSRPGFVFAPLWLIANRLWLQVCVGVIAGVAVEAALSKGFLAPGGALGLYLIGAFWTGLEGRNWLAAKLERRGTPLADIVAARDEDEAARLYLDRVFDPKPAVVPNPFPVAARPEPGIIGLFPEAQP